MNLNVILEQDLGYPHIQGPLLPAGRLEKVRLPTTEDDICNKDRDGIPRRNPSTLFPDLWVHPMSIPLYDLCFPPYAFIMFSHIEDRNDHILDKTKKTITSCTWELLCTLELDPSEQPLLRRAPR